MTQQELVPRSEGLAAARALVDGLRAVYRSLQTEQVLPAVVEGLSHVVSFDAAGVYVLDRARKALRQQHTVGYSDAQPAEAAPWVPDEVARVLATAEASLGRSDAPARGRRTARASLTVPIRSTDGAVFGAIHVESDRSEAYAAAALEALDLFASAVAGPLESRQFYQDLLEKRRIEDELDVARQVMQDLLPHDVPTLAGFEIAGAHETSYEVGGDYYEFIPLGDDRWGIVIADVVGKGVPAALLVAAMRASLSSLVSHELAQRAILRKANRFFHESVEDGKFVTLFYTVMDVAARRLIYVNAGHLPPVLLRADGRAELLEEGGIPLGLFREPRYQEGFARLETGDLLALYTDGITEASDPADEPYGQARLIEALRRLRSAPAAEICAGVIEDVRRFGGSILADDQTLVILKVT